MRRYFWSVFPAFGLNTESYFVSSVFSPNAGKYGPEITPYLEDFCAVIRKETIQKLLFKILCFNNKDTTKKKDLQKLSNKDTSFTLHSNNVKYTKFLKLFFLVKLYRRIPTSQPWYLGQTL